MAALTGFTPVVGGVADTTAAVSASDTIDQSLLGQRGVYLSITNGNASSDTVTVSDYGSTSAGNSLPSNQISITVTNGTSKVIWIKPSQVNPATGQVTVTHSVTASVTYQMYLVQ